MVLKQKVFASLVWLRMITQYKQCVSGAVKGIHL